MIISSKSKYKRVKSYKSQKTNEVTRWVEENPNVDRRRLVGYEDMHTLYDMLLDGVKGVHSELSNLEENAPANHDGKARKKSASVVFVGCPDVEAPQQSDLRMDRETLPLGDLLEPDVES